MLKIKIKRLSEQNELKTRELEEMKEKEKSDHSYCQIMTKIERDAHIAHDNNLYALFLHDQILNYNKKKPRYSEATIRNCVMWRISSPKGYEYCRKNLLKLPSRRTLQRYTGCGKDVSELIKCRLTAEADSLQPVERICSLIIDDMAIKEKLQYSKTEDKFYGLQTIKNKETFGKKPLLANKMLCFVIHGLSTKFTIPAAYFFHRTLKTPEFYNLTVTVLQQLHECGFIVLRIVTDNHKSNVALFKTFGSGKLLTHIEHPVQSSIPLFLSFDYCHAIKNARNLFLDHDMQSEEGVISSNYVKDLYKIQKNLIVKPVRFLTAKHVYPSNFEKMNVRRAVEIFSPPVTAAIKYLSQHQTSVFDFSNSNATVTYMETMYTFFQLHDVSGKIQHITQLEEKCAPYTHISDERLAWLTNAFPDYIDSIQECSKTAGLKGLSKETAEALKFTARSTSRCIQYLLEESGFYYVLTRCFSSDAVESMFSNVRMKGGSQDATDAQAADNAIRRIVQCGLVKTATSANVFSDCNYDSPIGQIKPESTNTILTSSIELPEDLRELIDDLQHLSTHLDYGILSASVAFLAGYIARTIEERIECQVCLESLLTNSCSSPLLNLIHLQNRGALRYPTKRFIFLINQIIKLALNIVEYLPGDCNPCSVLTSLLLNPLASSEFFVCTDHKEVICEIILSKLLKPCLTNIGKTRTDYVSTFPIYSKPSSRKILKL